MATAVDTQLLSNVGITLALGQPLKDLSAALVTTTQVSCEPNCQNVDIKLLPIVVKHVMDCILESNVLLHMDSLNDQFTPHTIQRFLNISCLSHILIIFLKNCLFMANKKTTPYKPLF